MVTLHECWTVYSVEDLYDVLEVAKVNAHNQSVANANRER
jgi:hypothetical protein